MSGLFSALSTVVSFITTLVEFLAAFIEVVISLFSVFFVSMPSFISTGLLFVFCLGLTILVIKLKG